MTITAEFDNDVKVLLVTEVPVYFDDIGMVKETLNLELSNELNQKVVPHYTFLFNYFEPHNHASPYLPCQIHTTELAFTQTSNYFKVLLTKSLLSSSRLR